MIQTRQVTGRSTFVPPMPAKPSIFLDFETLPTNDPEIIEYLTSRIRPPATMKKADTIATWETEEKPKLIEEAIFKTGLSGTYGRVCCAGFAINADPVTTFIGDETYVLKSFFNAVLDWEDSMRVTQEGNHALTVVGHNARSFDMRFVWQRAVIQRIKVPKSLPFNGSRWDDRIQDTMEMWDPDISKRTSLDRLCRALGVQSPKTDFDGTMVAAAFAAGQYSRISRYCTSDVESMRECYWRMVFA